MDIIPLVVWSIVAIGYTTLLAKHINRHGLDSLSGHRTYLIAYPLVMALMYRIFDGEELAQAAIMIGTLAGLIFGSKSGSGVRNKMSQDANDIKPSPAE